MDMVNELTKDLSNTVINSFMEYNISPDEAATIVKTPKFNVGIEEALLKAMIESVLENKTVFSNRQLKRFKKFILKRLKEYNKKYHTLPGDIDLVNDIEELFELEIVEIGENNMDKTDKRMKVKVGEYIYFGNAKAFCLSPNKISKITKNCIWTENADGGQYKYKYDGRTYVRDNCWFLANGYDDGGAIIHWVDWNAYEYPELDSTPQELMFKRAFSN